MKLKFVYIFVILAVFISACARPPLEEMQNAREAVFRAENDPNAVLFAANALARARDALERMELEAENKRYEAVTIHAAEAIAAAERAINDGRIGAARAREEAAAVVSGLWDEIEETQRNVNGARYSLLQLDHDELDREMRGVHQAADRAEASYAEGRYQDTLNIARDIRSGLSDINGRVAGAAAVGKR